MLTRLPCSNEQDVRLSRVARREAAQERQTAISPSNAADEGVAEHTLITLGTEEWAAFLAALDAPPRRHARMERLLKESSVLGD